MNCPTCQQDLTPYEHQGVKIDFCKGCGGSWFDYGEVAQYFLLEYDLPPDAEPLQSFSTLPKKCPRDQTPLKDFTYTTTGKLVIDVCGKCHGIWFDKGEVKKLEQLAHRLDRRLVKVFEMFDFDI